MLIEGIGSGIFASAIVLAVQEIKNYNSRKNIEKIKMYEFTKIGERDDACPPEYPRETEYNNKSEKEWDTVDIIEVSFPFDIKEIEIFEDDVMVYPTDNYKILPANEPIYVDCKLSIDEKPIFTIKCKTFNHEYREYEYIYVKKYSGGYSDYRLRLTKQSFYL